MRSRGANKKKGKPIMPPFQVLRPILPILIGASLMLTLSMGLRQSLGIFLQPLTHDVGISVSDFTLAIAVQNLAWGFLQPLAGALTVRHGFRAIMMVGALLYIAGLVLMISQSRDKRAVSTSPSARTSSTQLSVRPLFGMFCLFAFGRI